MGVIIRQTIKSSIVYYLAAMFGVINRLFLLPDFLTPKQIGFIDNFSYIALILGTLSMLGASGILTKYHKYFDKKLILKNLIGRLGIICLLGFGVFGTIFLVLKNVILNQFSIEDQLLLSSFYYYIPILALIYIIKSILNTYSSLKQKITIPTILNDLWIKIATGILLIVIGFKYIHFDQYVYLYISAYFISLSTMAYYCIKQLSLEISFKNKITKKETLMTLKYGGFLLLAGFSGQITQFADSLMLSSYEGFRTSGIYSIAFFIGMSIEMPKRALSTIATPIIASHFEDNKLDEINKLYKQSSINQGIIAFLFFILIFLNIDSLFYIIPKGETYRIGKFVALLIGSSKVIDMFMGVNSNILSVSKYYYLDLYFMLLFVFVTVLSNYLLIPIYQINGAAIATLISISLYNIVRFLVLKRFYNFNPFSIKSVKLISIFLFFLLLKLIIPVYHGKSVPLQILLIITTSGIITFIFTYLCYKTNISPEFNKLINLGLNKLRK